MGVTLNMGSGSFNNNNREEEDLAEAQYVKAKTSVWWDIENCHVPKESPSPSNPHSIARNISSALAKLNYCGPVSISAYGDTTRIPQAVQHALSSTGIALNHVPSGVKDASDKKILVDMLFWAVDNPAPATYLLISGDRDFSNALHQLRMRRYNILLAQPQNAPASLVAAAKSIWLWTSLLAGGPPLAGSDILQLQKESVISSTETLQSMLVSSSTNFEKTSSSLPENSSTVGASFASTKTIGKQNKIASNGCGSCAESCPQGKVNMNFPYQRPDFSGYMDTSFSNHMNQSNYPNMPWQNSHDMQSRFAQGNFYLPSSYARPPHAMPFVQPSYNNFSCYPPEYGLPMVSDPQGGIHNPPLFQQNNMQLRQPIPTEFTAPPPVRGAGGGGAFGNGTGYYNDRGTPVTCDASKPWNPYGSEVPHAFTVACAADTPDNGLSKTSGSSGLSKKAQCLLADAILVALRTLKDEKIAPTEANITDCFKYGELKYQFIDVGQALHMAMELGTVVKENLGAVEVYIGKNEKIWDCIDPLRNDPKLYPKATWAEIKRFLRSSLGKSKILASNCRYEAAIFMKTMCLQDHSLGDVLLLLNLTITNKKWLMPHPSGWKPIKILLPDYIDISLSANNTDGQYRKLEKNE